MASSPCDGWVDWQGFKCKSKCFVAFSLRTKSLTLICIYGDCNSILGFITLRVMFGTSISCSRDPAVASQAVKLSVAWSPASKRCIFAILLFTSRKINLDFCSAFEIRLLVESSVVYQAKTNDLFQYQTMRTTEWFDIFSRIHFVRVLCKEYHVRE